MYRPSFTPAPEPSAPLADETEINLNGTVTEILPSEKVYVGVTRKYFAMHRSDKTILEINLRTYRELVAKSNKYDHLLYVIGMLTWDTTNPVEDVMQGKYLLEGSNTKNLREVEKLEKTLPGLKDYLILKGELSI